MPLGLLFGLVFMLAGLAFKVSAAPFHMWTPDVYEGAPTPVTAFFATAPKVAAMALFARVVHDAFGGDPGRLGAGGGGAGGGVDVPRRGRRDRAARHQAADGLFLDRPHGLCADGPRRRAPPSGVQAMLVYMAIYVTMNIGTFAFILSMEKDGRPVTDIDSLNMYSKREPLRALAMLVLMFSLAGVPPMLGLLRQVLRAEGRGRWRAWPGWPCGGDRLGDRCLLLPADRLLHVFRREKATRWTARCPGAMGRCWWASAAIMILGVVNLFGIEALAAVAAETLVR